MKIVVDLQCNQSESRKGGIGRYSFDLLTAMIEARPDWQYNIVLNDLFPERANEIRYRLRNFIAPADIQAFKVPKNCAPANGNSQLTEAAEFIREKFISDMNPDVIHVASIVEGLFEDIVSSVKKFYNIPTVATLYDLIPLMNSDLYLRDVKIRSHYYKKIRELRRADGLLAISEYSAAEWNSVFEDYFGRVVNIKGGVDKKFIRKYFSSEVSMVRERYNLRKKIILYTASFDQRKNQSALIEAFAALPPSIRASHQLAFVGNGWPDIYDRLLALGRTRGLDHDHIRFLGHVPDADLIWLYNICDIFVFPPKWEGLGMPALEARACGAVVIGSNTTSVPEVIGWDEALFDPDDSAAMSRTMLRAIVDQDFREENRRRGAELVAQYQWRLSADVACDAIEDVVKARKAAPLKFRQGEEAEGRPELAEVIFAEELLRSESQDVSFCAAVNELAVDPGIALPKPRRGWITTWNSRCGIATYAEYMISEFEDRPLIFAPYEKAVFTREKEDGVIRCWSQGKEDCLLELETALLESGVSEVVVQFNYGFFDLRSLRRLIERLFSTGVAVYLTLHSTIDQDSRPEQRLPELVSALQLASGIFVHSEGDVRRLAAMGVAAHVMLLPHGIPHVSGTLRKPSEERAIVASYGFFLPGKGLLELIEATALLARSRPVELRMVNALYAETPGVSRDLVETAVAKIAELGLEANVTIYSDFLSDDESFDLIGQADIVVYPYTKTGESASGAVRLGLATGKLVAVSPLPIFDDVRDCVYVLPSSDPAGIASGLAQALDLLEGEDAEVEAIRRNAKRMAEVNSYRNIAEAFERYLAIRSRCVVWLDVFKFELTSQNIVAGLVAQGRLVSQGAGLLCHGPYLSLDPGVYRLSVHGDTKKLSGTIRLRVTADSGGSEIGCHDLDDSCNGVILDTVLCLSRKIDNVEFLFETTKDAQLSLATYCLSKRAR